MQRMILAVLLVAAVAAPGTAVAQHRQSVAEAPAGVMLNAHSVAALGTTVRPATGFGEPFSTGLGAGGGIQVGYGFTPRIMAYLGVEIAKQGSRTFGLDGNMGLTHLEAGARLSFPIRNSRIQPYVTASVARRTLGTTVVDVLEGESTKLRFSGMSVGAGGGIQYFLSPALAIDGGVTVGLGKFGTLKRDQDRLKVDTANSTTARLMAGLSWYPQYR